MPNDSLPLARVAGAIASAAANRLTAGGIDLSPSSRIKSAIENSAVKNYTIGTSLTLQTPTNMTGVAQDTLTGLSNVKVAPQPKPDPTYTDPNHFRGGPASMGTSQGAQPAIRNTPTAVKFNLPPHAWSLPLDQNSLTTGVTEKNAALKHSTRRATMWCYGYGAIDSTSGFDTTNKSLPSAQTGPLDTNWGFQFLWNPDKIANSLSRNSNFTPSAVDRLASKFGLFTAMEAVSFSIIIDRVNDFACIKSIAGTPDYARIAQDYYASAAREKNPAENMGDKVKRLAELGTMADVEYIYKMINGEGTGGVVWKNALGRETADLGFLAPTAVAVQFGPNPDSLSYVGYIDNITVAHNMFTEDMIPIHSEVTVTFVAFARTALAQKK